MDGSNIFSEPFLKEEEDVRSQVEVTSGVGGDPEDPSDRKLASSGKVSTHLRRGGDGDPSRTREESYMPQHHKSEVNPFVNRTMHLPWHQYVKMTIVGVTLLPLRLAFSLVNLLVMWAFASVVVMGLSEEAMQRPFNRRRLLLKYPICLCLRFQTFLFGFWWIRCKGKCADKSEAPIIVSNHISPFEPIYLVGKTMATPVQRVEDSRVPIIGTIQKAMQVMFVDRSDSVSRSVCLQTIEERSDPASPFPQVMVFPEGTCTNQQALITFKHGPFVPGQPVQPVIVRYRYRWLDPSYPAVAPSLIGLTLRVLCQVWNCMEVEFLPVYEPTSEDRANPTLFAAHVQEIMCRGLGVPATQHAFEDVALQVHAMKMNLNPEVAVVEWSRMKESVDIDARTAKECLVTFSQMDLDRDGRLTLEEFCAHWKRKRDRLAWKQRPEAGAVPRDRASTVDQGGQLLGAPCAPNRWASAGAPGRGSQAGVEGGIMRTEWHGALSSTAHGNLEEAAQGGSLGDMFIDAGEDEGAGAGAGSGTGWRAGLASPQAAATSTSTPAGTGPGLEDESWELPGILRRDEIELAFDIFSGGGDLDFLRFLTGLGVLSGLSREGRAGLFKFMFTMLQGREGEALSRIALERFIRRLRPDLSEANARELVDEAVKEAGARKGSGEEVKSGGEQPEILPQSISREEFLVFAETNGALLSVYQAILLNDILGAQRDITEFQLASDEHFGGVALDTSERSVTTDELAETRKLSYL